MKGGGIGMSKQQLFTEIVCVLRRNWGEEFLRRVLTRVLILEEALLEKEAAV